jgi:uracil phosphoribosyltransferase
MFDELPNVSVSRHPLVEDKLNRMRDETCAVPLFRRLMHEIGMLLTYEATLDLPPSMPWETRPVATPVAVKSDGRFIECRPPVIVPILRAGLVLAEGVHAVLPWAHIGHIGLHRDDSAPNGKQTRIEYLVNLPHPADRLFMLVDPMIAYGATACRAIKILRLNDIADENIRVISLIASYTGLLKLKKSHPNVRVYTAAVDGYQEPKGGLTATGYITPGLGDAGDRLFGTFHA